MLTLLLKQWLRAFGLVILTYNPNGIGYLSWVARDPDLPASLALLCGIALMAGYVFYIRGTLSAIGRWGALGLTVFLLVVLWTLADYRIVNTSNDLVFEWSLLIILSLVFAIGVSWPQLRQWQMALARPPRRLEATTDNDEEWLNFQNDNGRV